MKLSGKTALITGGGSGIGLAIARALADEGCRVVLAGRRRDVLEQAAATIPGATFHPVDVADPADVDRLFADVRRNVGPLDILINGAGTNVPRRRLAELSLDDWDAMMKVNCYGAFYCLRAAAPQMIERGEGLIVNIVSVSGVRAGLLGGVGYNASKFAAAALGITAAQELMPHGVRVTNVHPGEVDTPILEKRPTPVDDAHRARILQPMDVAAAVLMIACLPPRAHIAELTIKPTQQTFV